MVKTKGEHRKNFIKFLDRIAYDTSRWNVFYDFLKVSAIAISNNSDPYFLATSKEVREQREQEYLKIINSYNEDTRKMLHDMFVELLLELEEHCPNNFTDVLGELFNELKFHDHWKGQFFTPQHISDLIGRIMISSDTVNKSIEEKGFFIINEPCCGAGSMIIGALNAMHEIGLNHSKQVLVVASDIDERCVLMAYIQLSLYGVPAVIIQQNSLSMQTYGAPWYTPVFIFDDWTLRARRIFNQTSSIK